MNEDVGIRVRGPIVLQGNDLAIEIELVLLKKSLLRQCVRRRGVKVQMVGGDILGSRKPQPGVLVGHDRGARFVQPFVAVSMVEVPVGIDKELERVAPNGG